MRILDAAACRNVIGGITDGCLQLDLIGRIRRVSLGL
jgi:hypothetical protein